MRKRNLPNPSVSREERDKALANLVAQENIKRGAQKFVAEQMGVSVFIVNRAWKKYGEKP